MPTRLAGVALAISLLFTCGTRMAPGQERAASPGIGVDSLLRANAHPIRVEDGRLRGAGRDALAAAVDDGVRYVGLGEAPHLRASIPAFTGALFRLLHEEAGFQYLAVEEGPYIASLVSRAARRGGRDSVMALARRYPNAFHLYTVEELDLMTDVAAVSDAAGPPIWGLNRVYGALHLFERLAEVAPTEAGRRHARSMADSARPYEGERFARGVRYVGGVLDRDAIDELERRVSPAAGGEAARLIEQLRLSRQTFAPYQAESAPDTAFYHSALLRERNMKRLFGRRYRAARRGGAGPPRVLVKLGLYHLMRGWKPTNSVLTMGNHLAELATHQGGRALGVAVIESTGRVRGMLGPLARLAATGPVLVDVRPLQPLAGSGELSELGALMRNLLLSYEFVALLPEGERATWEPLRTPNFRIQPGG